MYLLKIILTHGSIEKTMENIEAVHNYLFDLESGGLDVVKWNIIKLAKQ